MTVSRIINKYLVPKFQRHIILQDEISSHLYSEWSIPYFDTLIPEFPTPQSGKTIAEHQLCPSLYDSVSLPHVPLSSKV